MERGLQSASFGPSGCVLLVRLPTAFPLDTQPICLHVSRPLMSRQDNLDTFFRDGKTVILPIDHGVAIPVPGLGNPFQLIEEVNPYVDGYVLNLGLALRTGDLLATGTISGPGERERGSLIELTWNEGPFLEDGDEVVFRGEPLGEVRGRIV